ncbi:unnamed protein product [Meganyctiphanes norvegica]|uniref:Uncharacterized protein n=1 Tax=Meganyctiphanes norvegica TaxID=48144 RepID=A0AAV2PMH2_MEGNR
MASPLTRSRSAINKSNTQANSEINLQTIETQLALVGQAINEWAEEQTKSTGDLPNSNNHWIVGLPEFVRVKLASFASGSSITNMSQDGLNLANLDHIASGQPPNNDLEDLFHEEQHRDDTEVTQQQHSGQREEDKRDDEDISSGRWYNMKRSLAAYRRSDRIQMNEITKTIQQRYSLEDLQLGRREIQEMQKNLEALKTERTDIMNCQNISEEHIGAFYQDLREHEKQLYILEIKISNLLTPLQGPQPPLCTIKYKHNTPTSIQHMYERSPNTKVTTTNI